MWLFRRFHPMPFAPALRKTVLTSVAGSRLTVHPTVFHPNMFRSSGFLARFIRTLDVNGKRVLDLGCGTGILGIAAARRGADVTAVDINQLALEATHENAERHNVTLRTLRSDWFSALHGETFDLILINPPFVKAARTAVTAASHAGEDHEHVLDMIEGCDDHLSPGGEVLMVLPGNADVEWWINEFATEGLIGELALRKRFWFEELTIFRFRA